MWTQQYQSSKPFLSLLKEPKMVPQSLLSIILSLSHISHHLKTTSNIHINLHRHRFDAAPFRVLISGVCFCSTMQMEDSIFFSIHFYSHSTPPFVRVWNRSVSCDEISYSWNFHSNLHPWNMSRDYLCELCMVSGRRGARERERGQWMEQLLNEYLAFMVTGLTMDVILNTCLVFNTVIGVLLLSHVYKNPFQLSSFILTSPSCTLFLLCVIRELGTEWKSMTRCRRHKNNLPAIFQLRLLLRSQGCKCFILQYRCLVLLD